MKPHHNGSAYEKTVWYTQTYESLIPIYINNEMMRWNKVVATTSPSLVFNLGLSLMLRLFVFFDTVGLNFWELQAIFIYFKVFVILIKIQNTVQKKVEVDEEPYMPGLT